MILSLHKDKYIDRSTEEREIPIDKCIHISFYRYIDPERESLYRETIYIERETL